MKMTYLLIFGTSFLSSLVLTRLAYSIAHSLEFTAQPGDRKIHEQPVAYLGGLAVFLAFCAGLIPFVNMDLYYTFLLFATAVTVLGLADDAIDLAGTLKIVILLIIGAGVAGTIDRIHLFPYIYFGEFGFYLDVGTTALWVLLVISAFNAIDNMDGLAPGLALIASLAFFVISGYQFSQPFLAVIAIALAGACLGFLPYNFHPAIVFLGDSGSYLIGFLLASMAFFGEWSTHPLKAFTIPLVILSVPILDLIFTILYRLIIGDTQGIIDSIEYSAKDHLSHRIQLSRNFGQRRTALIIYALGLTTGIIGIIMRNTYPFEAIMALITAIAVYAMVVLIILPNQQRILEKWRTNYEKNEAGN